MVTMLSKMDKPASVFRMGSFSDYKHHVITNELTIIRSSYECFVDQGIKGLGGLFSTKRWMNITTGTHPMLKLSCLKGNLKCAIKLDASLHFRVVKGTNLILQTERRKIRLRFPCELQTKKWLHIIDEVIRHAVWLLNLTILNESKSINEGKLVKCFYRNGRFQYIIKIMDKSDLSALEIEALCRLHKNSCDINVVKCIRIYESNNQDFIVMPYYSHQTLLEKLEKGCLTEYEAARVTKAIISGLQQIHRAGLIHCDIKLENLVFESSDLSSIRIIDFGSAYIASKTLAPAMETLLGTPGYISPERLEGEVPTEVSDIFSVGIVLYQMLSGRHPFQSRRNREISLKATQQFQLNFESSLWKDISSNAKDILRLMLAQNPRERIDCKGVLNHSWINM